MKRDNALIVNALVKSYGKKRAVDHLSFSVKSGSIYGLLGPNGAGKTTTLECIEGLKGFDSGEILVEGINPTQHRKNLWKTIGVQLQSSSLPSAMTAREALTFFSHYHNVKPDLSFLTRMGLEKNLDVPYGSYSTGQKRRLTLALAVSHNPKIVFLDEPTAGLDVQSRIELHQIMRELREEGTTLVLATHDMAEAQMLCDTIGIIIGGKMAIEGTPSHITSSGDTRTRITVSTENHILIENPGIVSHADILSVDDEYVRYQTDNPALSVSSLLTALQERGDTLIDLRVERPSLEERFIEIIKNQEEQR